MKKNLPTSFDDLIKSYYSSSKETVKSAETKIEELLASYYGKPLARPGEAKFPSVTLSLSMDDGEVLTQRGQAAGFEEYVVPQSLDDINFEEYVVPSDPVARQSSLVNRPGETVRASQEYQIDIFQALPDSASNTSTPPQAAQSPAGQPAAGAQPAASSPSAPVSQPPDVGRPPAVGQPPAPSQPAANLPKNPPVSSLAPGEAKANEDDFLADLQAILQGQKVYDATSGKTVEKDKLGQSQSIARQADGPGRPMPDAKNEQAIFDRIAQSMQYATAYDLGTVELNNRFEDFDKLSELQEKAREKKAATPQASGSQTSSQASVSTSEFMADLQAMRLQQAARAGDTTSPEPSQSMSVDDGFSRPMFDTGEHAQMGGNLYVDQLHVGKEPRVAFSYGQIIAMADLYESVDQMLNTDVGELENIKKLIQRDTNYYKGNKANKALSVSNSEWEQATGGRYLKLAEENYEHFSPNLYFKGAPFAGTLPLHGNHRSAWEQYHRRAIAEAQGMFLAHPNQSLFLEQPLIINAFGDHFLTDSFAAGHQINKEEMIALFKANFYNGSDLTSSGEDFFAKVAELAFKGEVKKKFSVLETYDPVILWWHPNIDTVNAFRKLLVKAAEQQPEAVANVAVKALHDYLNQNGIEVTNGAGDAPWTITGDAYMNAKNLAIIRKAVQQSADNINDPSIFASNIDFGTYFARVWKYTPQLTSASQRKLIQLMQDYTNPNSSTLQTAAADIIYHQVDALIKKLKDEKKLRDA